MKDETLARAESRFRHHTLSQSTVRVHPLVMPRVIIIPAYYTGVPVSTYEESCPDDVTQHPSYDAAIAYWQCEFGYGEPKLLDRANGRYVVEFSSLPPHSQSDSTNG